MARTIATPEPSTGAGSADAAVTDLVRRGYVRGRVARLTGPAADLRDHLRAGGLEVHYQPIVSLPDRRLQGFEALARIRTATGQLLHPERFIDLAETSGLIVPLGLEVLATAVSDLARWRAEPALAGASVSVNVSPSQLTDDTFAASVRQILHEHGLPAAAIVLEITEGQLAGPDVQRTVEVVEATGVRLALDDFGTGFATLDSLRRLPVQMLKLEQSFVQGIGCDGLDTVLVRNVLDLAYELDLVVVAEGVETDEQAASLAAWGCTSGQGLLFGPPVPAHEVTPPEPGPDRGPSTPMPPEVDQRDRMTAMAVARTLALTDDGPHHRAHVHMVATGLGKAMRLPAATLHEIEQAALCHDVERLAPLLRDGNAVTGLPPVLQALIDPQAGAPDRQLAARLVRSAVDVVTDATTDHDRGPSPGRLAAALVADASSQPDGIARAMRRLAEHLPTATPTAEELLRAEGAGQGDLRSTEERLRALRALSRAVDPTADSRNLVGVLADEALEIVGAASLSLSRWERDEGVLRVLVNVGQLADSEQRFPDDETYAMTEYMAASRMLAAGVPYLVRLDDDNDDPGGRALLRALGKGSSAAVPVYADQRLWGELYATTAVDEPPFATRDIDLLTVVADILGGALAYGEQLERMERLAFEDPLTGLANRRAVDDRLEQALAQTTAPVTVIMIDVNGLKQVNDEYGHATGDRALRAVADALSGATLDMPGATCARLGGDEFCVILAGDDGRGAAPVVHRAVAQLRNAPAPQVTISAGAATSDVTGRSVRELFAAADRAQYQAKHANTTLLLAGSTQHPHADGAASGRDHRGAHRADDAGSSFEVACGQVIEVLGRLASAPPETVLEAIGAAMADTCDVGRWLLSRIDRDGVIRIQHLHLRRTRPAPHHSPVVQPEDEVYHLDDYPVTRAAVEGPEPFWVHVDDPDHDAAERAVLADIGMTAVLGIGAPDDDGAWLLELYADEQTDDLAAFAPLARVVALTLHTRGGAATAR